MVNRNILSKTLKVILFLALGIFLLWLAFKNIDIATLVEGLKSANYWWLIPALAFTVASFFARAARWQLLIEPLGYSPKYINTVYAVFSGYFANIAVPRLGEVTKCIGLNKKENIPVDKLLGTIVAERAIDLLCTLIITIALIVGAGKTINLFLKENIFAAVEAKGGNMITLLIVMAIVLLAFLGVAIFVCIKYRATLRRYKAIAKILDFCKGVFDGIKAIVQLNRRWEFVLYTVLLYVSYILMTWLFCFCVESMSGFGLGDALFLLVAGTFGVIVPVQSGFGAYHYIVSRGVAFVYGISLEDGLLYAFISHESELIITIILGAIATILLFANNKNATFAQQNKYIES